MKWRPRPRRKCASAALLLFVIFALQFGCSTAEDRAEEAQLELAHKEVRATLRFNYSIFAYRYEKGEWPRSAADLISWNSGPLDYTYLSREGSETDWLDAENLHFRLVNSSANEATYEGFVLEKPIHPSPLRLSDVSQTDALDGIRMSTTGFKNR